MRQLTIAPFLFLFGACGLLRHDEALLFAVDRNNNNSTCMEISIISITDEISKAEKNQDVDLLKKLYAQRSLLHARYYRLYGYTTDCIVSITSDYPMMFLITPLVFVLDTVTLPYDLYRDSQVTEKNIQDALTDIKKARDLGFLDRDIGEMELLKHKFLDLNGIEVSNETNKFDANH